MAKKTKKQPEKAKKKKKQKAKLPFTRKNYQLFGIGILTIIIGYIFLSIGPWNSFPSLTIAPIILVIGYLVIIPLAILYREKGPKEEKVKTEEQKAETQNIKTS